MTSLPETLILVCYFFVLSILAIYGWHCYYLVYLYMKNRDKVPDKALPPPTYAEMQRVTIQLPIYNEMYVADRLIDAVCEMDYPRELLEIQVLDDSTDETREIAELAVRRHAARGFDITYLHRVDRTGYKAGALEAGLRVAKADFIAIFDADFIPPKDFLLKTLPHFSEPNIGMVQARWGHINQGYSLLTKVQSILLEVGNEQARLDLRQQGIILVDVPPARLDHPDVRLAEVRQRLEQEILRGNEIRVEDRDEIRLGDAQPRFERARLVAGAVDAVQVGDIEAARGMPANGQLGDFARFVGRVVKDLDFEQLPRVIHFADRVDQAVRHVHFVVNRELDRDALHLRVRRRRKRLVRDLVPIFHVKINEVIAVPAVNGQDTQDEEVTNEDECLRQRRHKEMKRSRSPIGHVTVQ